MGSLTGAVVEGVKKGKQRADNEHVSVLVEHFGGFFSFPFPWLESCLCVELSVICRWHSHEGLREERDWTFIRHGSFSGGPLDLCATHSGSPRDATLDGKEELGSSAVFNSGACHVFISRRLIRTKHRFCQDVLRLLVFLADLGLSWPGSPVSR